MANNGHMHTLNCGCHNRVAEFIIDQFAANQARLPVQAPKRVRKAKNKGTGHIFHAKGGVGTIRPLSGGVVELEVEALGIVNDKVVASGAYDFVKSELAKKTDTIQETQLSEHQCLIPGLIEPHAHIVLGSVAVGWNDYTAFKNVDGEKNPLLAQNLREDYSLNSLLQKLRNDISGKTADNWLLGAGVDPSLFANINSLQDGETLLNLLDYTVLDQVSDTVPIMLLSASGHTIYANSPALIAAWNHESDLQQAYAGPDDYIKDTQGVLQEIPEMAPMIKSVPGDELGITEESVAEKFKNFFAACHRRGITMIYDAGMIEGAATVLKNYIQASEDHTMRIGMARLMEKMTDVVRLGPFTPPSAPGEDDDIVTITDNANTIDFYYGSAKIVSDGSNQGLTGYQSSGYCCPTPTLSASSKTLNSEPIYHGIYNYLAEDVTAYSTPTKSAPDEVLKMIKGIHDKGWQVMIHANGDQAIDYALQGFAQMEPAENAKRRHRIEHCSLLDDGRLKKIVDYNISPSFLIGHVGYWGWAFKSYIFGDMAEDQLDRCKSTADQNVRFTMHSDFNVSPIGPLRLMEQAVTRTMEATAADKATLNPDERITAARALLAVTYDAAWQCHADHLVGSLEAGKLADFVILAQDPIKMTADTAYDVMRHINVDQIWIGGARISS